MKQKQINQIVKVVAGILAVACATVVAGLGLQSCNVVRTITNQSEYYQRGDTSVMIQTRTVESYDASKKL
jgi:biotin carboxylase